MLSPEELESAVRSFVYQTDVRNRPSSLHKRQFSVGWNDAIGAKEYREQTLLKLTWRNLGYRLGQSFGKRDVSTVESAYRKLSAEFRESMATRVNTWIFQGNPEIYDLKAALNTLDSFHWCVRQHKTEIEVGDQVYLWASGVDGGMLGTCVVDSEVFEGKEEEEERKYWIVAPEDGKELRVRLTKEESFQAPVDRAELKAEPGLSDLALLKIPNRTNFKVSDDEAGILRQLTADRPTIDDVVQRYWSENVVFKSTQGGAEYSISEVDESGFLVDRLNAEAPQRCTFDALEKAVINIRDNGGSVPYDEFVSNTIAHRSALLQGPGIGISLDRRTVVDLESEKTLLEYFCELIRGLNVDRSSGKPKLYKPVLLECVINAIGDGDLIQNHISFDLVLPRFKERLRELGEEGGEQQCSYAFCSLANELFWMLSYNDLSSRLDRPGISPANVRRLVKNASLKDDLWWLLRKHSNRKTCLDVLSAEWWPQADTNVNNFWWVNQGKTFSEERKEGIVWAPKENAEGQTQFHWENVRLVRKGDIVFNYASGSVKAISIALRDGDSHTQPESLQKSKSWEQEGWLAPLEYTDLDIPLLLDLISDSMRRLPGKYLPINRTGRVNQGYLYRLNEQAVRILGEAIDLSSLPSRIAGPIRVIVDDQWGRFVYWGSRFFENDETRAAEREYKFTVEKRLAIVRQILELGEGDWLAELKSSFNSPSNLTDYRSHGAFLEWCSANQSTAKQLLVDLWAPDVADLSAAEGFLENLQPEAVKGCGTRVNIASFLSLARGAVNCPIFKSTPFETGVRLTGFQSLPKSDVELYSHAIRFIDRVIYEAGKRGVVLNDRLDAQCFLWCVAKYAPPEHWEDEDKQSLLKWRDGVEDLVAFPELTGLELLAEQLLFDSTHLKEIERLIVSKGQLIFYGPPGTGKTFVAKAIANFYAGVEGVEIVQFHPSYTYEDFVEGYRPCLHNETTPGFKLAKGPLRVLAERAQMNPEQKFVLIIDEINRGNVAKVFGELYFLLEYRDEAIKLQYDGESKFSLPRNLWIIGTMNTADRSIALIDSALRRRFYFCPFFPDKPPVESLLRRWLKKNKPKMGWVADVVEKANERLGDRHGAIGPSYFLRDDLDDEWVESIWRHAVLPYLEEQFFGEEEQLEKFELSSLRVQSEQDSEVEASSDAGN